MLCSEKGLIVEDKGSMVRLPIRRRGMEDWDGSLTSELFGRDGREVDGIRYGMDG
jgi:hypothetical protein